MSQRPPQAEGGGHSHPVASFEEVLAQLRCAHLRELTELRRESERLRHDVESWRQQALSDSSRWRATVDTHGAEKHILGATAPRSVAHCGPRVREQAIIKPPMKPHSCLEMPMDTREAKPPVTYLGDKSSVEKLAVGSHTINGFASGDASRHADKPLTPGSAASDAMAVINLMTVRSKRKAPAFEDMAPRAIHFEQLCSEKFPGRTWDDLNVRERVKIIGNHLKPNHYLMSPHSRFIKCWDTLLAVALAFVGIVTPYEVVFLPGNAWGFFTVNRLVDCIFAFDIVLQFFTQVEIQRPHRGGNMMLRDPTELRIMYLKSWFLPDLVSIFPFDALSLIMRGSSPFWRRAKILRCLRLMRLAKLVRMLRTWKLQQRWRNAVGMQFGTQKLIRFCIVLMLVSHWMACIWGLTGLTLGAELCDAEGDPVNFGAGGVGINEVSWATTLYLGGKTSPDTPCNPFEIYSASLHWAVMTLTSIGYGDIYPVRVEEYIVGVLCMLAGGVLWAYVIGSVCSVISNVSPVERKFETNTDLLNLAMEEACVPHEQRQEYREYLREAKAYDRRVCFQEVAQNFSPMLRKHLLYHSAKGAIGAVYYFKDPEVSEAFLMDIASYLLPRFFSRFESLDYVRQCLCLMDRGTVAHCGTILVYPSAFNEDFIISQKRYQQPARTVSLTYTQLMVLTRNDLEDMLESHPLMARKIWRTAMKGATIRALLLTANAYRSWLTTVEEGSREKLSLSEAFDRFRSLDEISMMEFQGAPIVNPTLTMAGMKRPKAGQQCDPQKDVDKTAR